MIDAKATVAARLEEAGAVLVAKLSLGALAEGDRWFGGMTRNPWNVREGSSGSSAGSACAVAAGLVGFALGSETLGSIVSPCIRCGATGLRPTFGRVSRHGCMTLAWSMDKIGPIARSVEDCALVFGAIHGADGLDPTAVDQPFDWPPRRDLARCESATSRTTRRWTSATSWACSANLGVKLVPIKLPAKYPLGALTRDPRQRGGDRVRRAHAAGHHRRAQHLAQHVSPQAEFVPAVEYLRANRIRTLVMREMEEVMSQVDLYVGGGDLVLTN